MKLLLSLAWFHTAAAAALNLTILHMNDHHSNLEQDDFDVEVVDLPFNLSDSSIEEVSIPYGGFARIKSYLDKSTMMGNNTLKLHAGDALVGTPIYSIFQVQADAAVMRELCFDAFCLGNHVRIRYTLRSIDPHDCYLCHLVQEFDDGDSNLADFINALRSSDTCETAVLGANVLPGESSPLRSLQESGLLSNSQVFEFDDEEQVGVVGINIRNKTLLSSRPDEGTTLSDERETARTEVEALTNAGVNKIVLLTHIGYDLDLEWMVNIPNVDVIVGGDSHTLLGENGVFEAAAPYPGIQTASDGRTVCVVQAWEFAHGLGELNVEFDDNGEVISCSGHPVFPIGTPELDNAEEAMAVTEYLVGLGDSFVLTEPDANTMMVLEGFTGQLSSLLAETIATVPEDICFERIPGQGRSTICPAEASKEQGGGVCNLVAQAFLSQTLEAQVAIQNGGGYVQMQFYCTVFAHISSDAVQILLLETLHTTTPTRSCPFPILWCCST